MATSDGSLYMGNIDPRDGGECRITKEFHLFGAGCGNNLQEEDRTADVSSSAMYGTSGPLYSEPSLIQLGCPKIMKVQLQSVEVPLYVVVVVFSRGRRNYLSHCSTVSMR